MSDLIKALKDTNVPTILTLAGIGFLLLGIAGGIAGKIQVAPKRQRVSLLVGTLLMVLGVAIYLIPASGTPDPKGSNPTSSAKPPENVVTNAPLPIDIPPEGPRSPSQDTESRVAVVHGDRCAPGGIKCTPSAGATLEHAVAAGRDGHNADAVCLAQAVVNAHPEGRIAGPAWFEAASAWKAMDCARNAGDAIERSIALRPHGDAGWKDTCVLCRQVRPSACNECRGLETPPDALLNAETAALSRGDTAELAAVMDDAAVAISPEASGLVVGRAAIKVMLDNYFGAIDFDSARPAKTFVGQERDHAWIAQRFDVTTKTGNTRSILVTQLAHQVNTPSGVSWRVTASHFAELLGNDDAQALVHRGELPSPAPITGAGPPDVRATVTEMVKSPRAIADAIAERQDAQWFGSAFREVLLGNAEIQRHFKSSDRVSPPAIVGTSFTGSTGTQGPTRWRADGSSPCPCRD